MVCGGLSMFVKSFIPYLSTFQDVKSCKRVTMKQLELTTEEDWQSAKPRLFTLCYSPIM